MKQKNQKWNAAELKLKLQLRMSLIILFDHTNSVAGNWEMIEENDLKMLRIGIYRWQEAYNVNAGISMLYFFDALNDC